MCKKNVDFSKWAIKTSEQACEVVRKNGKATHEKEYYPCNVMLKGQRTDPELYDGWISSSKKVFVDENGIFQHCDNIRITVVHYYNQDGVPCNQMPKEEAVKEPELEPV